VPWGDFRGDIEAVTESKSEERKSNAGRKPYDAILKFNILVLQSLYNLSDEQTEFLIRDLLSFRRFLDLGLEDAVPDATTLWLFREALAQAGLIDELFERFGQHLEAKGYIARGGQIVDASIVSAPQHQGGERGDNGRHHARGLAEETREERAERQGLALDQEPRPEPFRLQEPRRRGQGAQAGPQVGCQ
jgi:transposase, IS5 family